MTVYFYTLGCKVNQYETQEMSELFIKAGYSVVFSPESADIIVVNSCTVTAESVRKVRQTVRKLHKTNPDALLVLTGCASQAEPEEIKEALPEIDVLFGNKNNINIVTFCEKAINENKRVYVCDEHKSGEPFKGTGITAFEGHTRAFLKIQDGCDRFCSYCLIPNARGRSRSKSPEDIDRELKALSENGYSEIVFVGINLSDYGKNTPYSLPDALLLAEKYDGIKRVRLGSLEPDHITDKMIEEFAGVSKLCHQFHISVQSGSNNVLKRMNRHYTAEQYIHLAQKLRETFNDTTITTDIIAGFPTETDEDFAETLEFVKKVKFEKAHIFPYSKRNNTVAAKLPQIQNSVKEERAKRLTGATEKIRREFLKNQIGKTYDVLFETEHTDYSEGYTANYIPVRIYDEKSRKGKILSVKITGTYDDGCTGEEI